MATQLTTNQQLTQNELKQLLDLVIFYTINTTIFTSHENHEKRDARINEFFLENIDATPQILSILIDFTKLMTELSRYIYKLTKCHIFKFQNTISHSLSSKEIKNIQIAYHSASLQYAFKLLINDIETCTPNETPHLHSPLFGADNNLEAKIQAQYSAIKQSLLDQITLMRKTNISNPQSH